MLHTSDFDFELPSELIASHPLPQRDASRMLVVQTSCASARDISDSGQMHNISLTGIGSQSGTAPSSPPVEGCPQGGVVYPTSGRSTIDYLSLPYNPDLVERAKELRKAGSLPEALLWKEIKSKKINGLDFDRQKIIGNYIVDFYCAANRLVIEIDDKSHDVKREYDQQREQYLCGLGLTVLHFSASDILKDVNSTVQYLVNHPAAQPHPSNGGELVSPNYNGGELGQSVDGGTCYSTGGESDTPVSLADKHIRDFLDYLQAGDVVVFNNSRVIPARFMASGHEITLHTSADNGETWWGLCRKFTKLKTGQILTMDDGTALEILSVNPDTGIKIRFFCDNIFAVLDRVGKMPLPPYMKRDQEDADRERYQTVYAGPLGSMAAPTAGLHFTPELLQEIEDRGAKIVKITLHVGAGTWMPVKTENLSEHKMHSEWFCITPDQAQIINNANRVIAVGTTSLRALESAAKINHNRAVYSRVAPIARKTGIFITPGYRFRAVDVLLTNFHLPKSTLFMLVSAFAGMDEMRAAYQHAITEKYRFFSYGDCCLLFKKKLPYAAEEFADTDENDTELI